MFEGLKTISFYNEFRNGAKDEKDFAPRMAFWQEIKGKLERGERVYVGFTTGERAGSIAYIKAYDPNYDHERDLNRIDEGPRWSRSYYEGRNWLYDPSLSVILGWDKRSNKIKFSLSGYDKGMVYFPDYEGPTVWEKFDKKAVEKAATAKVVVKDRFGNVIKKGDEVVYINARYGSGAALDRGTIADIKVKVDVNPREVGKVYHHIEVLIDNEHGESSKIKKPELSIMKV